MNYKDFRVLVLFLIIIFIFFYNYMLYIPLFLLLLFVVLKYLDKRSMIKTDSIWVKGICYGGLGFVSFLDAIGILDAKGHASVSVYVATMCFMEFFDLSFDWKKSEELDSKKHGEALNKIHHTRSKKARIAKPHKKA